jgi:hypothetical protein
MLFASITAVSGFIGIVATAWLTLGFPTVVLSNNLAPLIMVSEDYVGNRQYQLNREEIGLLEQLQKPNNPPAFEELLKDQIERIKQEREKYIQDLKELQELKGK